MLEKLKGLFPSYQKEVDARIDRLNKTILQIEECRGQITREVNIGNAVQAGMKDGTYYLTFRCPEDVDRAITSIRQEIENLTSGTVNLNKHVNLLAEDRDIQQITV